jgi:hypothetical protein
MPTRGHNTGEAQQSDGPSPTALAHPLPPHLDASRRVAQVMSLHDGECVNVGASYNHRPAPTIADK